MNRIRIVALLVMVLVTAGGFQARGDVVDAKVVIAHADTGINPYASVFRDTSPRAYQHPSTYLVGYPTNAERLDLTLDAASWQAAFTADKAIWDGLLADYTASPAAFRARVFWIPGTKIVAARRQATGGTFCPPVSEVSPAPWAANPCTDYPLLDDHGHGTMTATRMGGNRGSLCPECLIVSVEGLGDLSVKWIADQGWIDVQTNSWAFIVPHQVIYAIDYPLDLGIQRNLEAAAAKMAVFFATGNGLGGAAGFAPCPSVDQTTLVRGAIWVGAHDNGRVAAWSCAPAHVVADGYAGLVASNRSIDGFGPSPFACCTSASSPYAAGGAAAMILRARRFLGDGGTGWRGGAAAIGAAGLAPGGPLVDGRLELEEFRALVKHTAEARPREGKDDGAVQWVGEPRVPSPSGDLLPYGPGGNAYCNGCWTLPVEWSAVPEDVPAYASIGYGAVNERSLARAVAVLEGGAQEPSRADVDEFFTTEGEVRDIVHHPDRLLE